MEYKMPGMNVGTSNLGSFRGMPEQKFDIPKQEQRKRRHSYERDNQTPGVDTGPSTTPTTPAPRWSKFGGMSANQDILPSTMDPYRTYGTVSGGTMTPPTNPYGQNQPIRFTPSGEYGPINTGPTQISPSIPSPQDYMNRGGFTGGGPNYTDPNQANIPNTGQSGMLGGLRNAYGGAGMGGGRFRNNLFY